MNAPEIPAVGDRTPQDPALDRSITGNPVRVCFISPLGYGLYRPESGYPFGGAELQFFLLARALAEDPAYQVSVLTTVSDGAGTEQHGRVTLIKRQGQQRLLANSVGGATRAFRAGMSYLAAFEEMRRLFRSVDADVYLHSGAGVEVGAYSLICRLLRRRFIYIVASSVDLVEPNGNVSGPLRSLFPMGLRLASTVVCQTEEQLDWLRQRYRRNGVLIRNGHPISGRTASPDQQKRTTILWVGRSHPVKQPHLFMDLAERLPTERCVMVVMRDLAYEGVWKGIRERAETLPNLILHENVRWDAMDRIFAEAKLYVNTSSYEGFPNTFVQAAIQGVPILSLNVDPDRVLVRHQIGVCAEGSFDRLVASVTQLCMASDQREELGRRALAYAAAYHDLSRSVNELKALVRALTGSSQPVGSPRHGLLARMRL